MSKFPVYARITGPIVMIGFGSIGKGTLPMIERQLLNRQRFFEELMARLFEDAEQ